jgi:SAM-dependent methyltransferase
MPTSNSFAEDSTVRFSDRVEAYLAGRPRYPLAIVDDLARRAALTPQAVIADVGVGTGLSAEPFLASGYRVIGVEPNAAMRAAGLEFLSRYPRYECRDGSADATGIDAASVDVVIAVQAFHWFDPGPH